MSIFFPRKRRFFVPRRTALALNALNLLAPVLLAVAVLLIGSTKVGACPPALRDTAMRWGAFLVLGALAVRLVWAVGIRLARKHTSSPDDE